jgi:SAM-dependent methyltransferase
VAEAKLLAYQCNICGTANEIDGAQFDREKPSCVKCGSTVRLRALALLIAEELAGAPMALPDLPAIRSIEGIGMSDPDFLAAALEPKFRYVNTFYHKPPYFDVLAPDAAQAGRYDFVVSSEVLEHVPDPVSRAFHNLAHLLKPGGILLLTTPYSLADADTEHFPGIQRHAVVELDGRWVLVYRDAEGCTRIREDLAFHGGDGSTLEMRVFSETGLKALLTDAGFADIRIAGSDRPEFGIYQTDPWSLPIAARKCAPGAVERPVFAELALDYAAIRVKLRNAERQLRILKEEYAHHVSWADEKVRQLEDDLKRRNAWGEGLEKDFEERTAWAVQLRDDLEAAKSELATHESELENRTHWALGLQAEIDRRDAKQRGLEVSRWYRWSKKLGLIED